ncbi:MAG: hypothetical protein RL497_1406 [Pseudomonadota bacterium]|jgi:hypothetical protein
MVFSLRIFTLLCLVAGPAFATNDCLSKSPQFASQGELYWEINPIKNIPEAHKNNFIIQAEKMAGRIQGDLNHEECTGSQNNILKTNIKATAKGTIAMEKNGVKLILEVTDIKNKKIKTERLEFLGKSATVAFLADKNSGSFMLQQKARTNAQTKDKISLLREVEYSIKFNKNKLFIRALHYANGFYYAEDTWELARR